MMQENGDFRPYGDMIAGLHLPSDGTPPEFIVDGKSATKNRYDTKMKSIPASIGDEREASTADS